MGVPFAFEIKRKLSNMASEPSMIWPALLFSLTSAVSAHGTFSAGSKWSLEPEDWLITSPNACYLHLEIPLLLPLAWLTSNSSFRCQWECYLLKEALPEAQTWLSRLSPGTPLSYHTHHATPLQPLIKKSVFLNRLNVPWDQGSYLFTPSMLHTATSTQQELNKYLFKGWMIYWCYNNKLDPIRFILLQSGNIMNCF